jgi:hypothetical protein
MKQSIIAGAALAAVLATAIAAPSARAATPEETYIATRDAAIAHMKAVLEANKRAPSQPSDNKVYDEDTRALATLLPQMRAIVGPVAIKGVSGDGKLNSDTLMDGDEGFGMLDGIVYGADTDKTRVIVTTESLFKRWLEGHKNWWDRDFLMPQDMSEAVQTDAFYTQAVSTDAAVSLYADLPVRKPAGATFAYATLAARSQDTAPPTASEMFVVAAQGGRVFIAYSKDFTPVGPIAACDAVRRDYDKKASDVLQNSTLSEDEQRKQSDEMSGKSETEFLRCFEDRAKHQPGFAAATKGAQDLLERFTAR